MGQAAARLSRCKADSKDLLCSQPHGTAHAIFPAFRLLKPFVSPTLQRQGRLQPVARQWCPVFAKTCAATCSEAFRFTRYRPDQVTVGQVAEAKL